MKQTKHIEGIEVANTDAKKYRGTTPVGIVSWPQVWTPEANERGELFYELTVIFPAGTDVSEMAQFAAAVIAEKWPQGAPADLINPFKPNNKPNKIKYDGYKQHPDGFHIRFKTKTRPGVVDCDLAVLTPADTDKFYPGCWVFVTYNAYAYDKKGNRGAGFGLQNIQVVRDGTRLGGRPDAATDFDRVEPQETACSTGGDDWLT